MAVQASAITTAAVIALDAPPSGRSRADHVNVRMSGARTQPKFGPKSVTRYLVLSQRGRMTSLKRPPPDVFSLATRVQPRRWEEHARQST
jgi:hypothetical protein